MNFLHSLSANCYRYHHNLYFELEVIVKRGGISIYVSKMNVTPP